MVCCQLRTLIKSVRRSFPPQSSQLLPPFIDVACYPYKSSVSSQRMICETNDLFFSLSVTSLLKSQAFRLLMLSFPLLCLFFSFFFVCFDRLTFHELAKERCFLSQTPAIVLLNLPGSTGREWLRESCASGVDPEREKMPDVKTIACSRGEKRLMCIERRKTRGYFSILMFEISVAEVKHNHHKHMIWCQCCCAYLLLLIYRCPFHRSLVCLLFAPLTSELWAGHENGKKRRWKNARHE